MKISQRTINSLKIFLLIAFVVELYSFSTVTIDSFARIPNLLFEILYFVYSFSKFLFPVVFVSLLIFVNKQKSDMQKVLSTNLRVITCLYIVNFIYRTFLVRNIFGFINNDVLYNIIAVIGHLIICIFCVLFFIKISKYKNDYK